MHYHADTRRTFYGDIYGNPDGDINVVYLQPHIPIGWHRHQHQSDRLFLIQGVLRVKSFTMDYRYDGVEHILVAKDGERDVVHIPADTWHAYEALTDDTIVLQFNGPGKWTGEDEERCGFEVIPWTW